MEIVVNVLHNEGVRKMVTVIVQCQEKYCKVDLAGGRLLSLYPTYLHLVKLASDTTP